MFDCILYVDEFIFFSEIIRINFWKIVRNMWYLFPDFFGKSTGFDSL